MERPKARLTIDQHQRAINASIWIDASPHEWPTIKEIPLLCNCILDQTEMVDFLQRTIAAIRAELAAARQHAEYQDKEIRQWASVCYVGTWPLSDEETKNTGFYGRLAAKMTAERNTATARAEKAEKQLRMIEACVENDDCADRPLVERVASAVPSVVFLLNAHADSLERAEKAEAEATALKAHVERLRGALECIPVDLINAIENGEKVRLFLGTESCRLIGSALAATPAQSLAAVKAEVLLDACKDREHGGLCQRVAVDYLDWTGKEPLASQLHARPMFRLSVLDADEVMKMAERLQAEAANGTT